MTRWQVRWWGSGVVPAVANPGGRAVRGWAPEAASGAVAQWAGKMLHQFAALSSTQELMRGQQSGSPTGRALRCAVLRAGRVGRRGDMAGGFTLMEREDLRRVAPLWLKYTEDVREDPAVRGDLWVCVGGVWGGEGGGFACGGGGGQLQKVGRVACQCTAAVRSRERPQAAPCCRQAAGPARPAWPPLQSTMCFAGAPAGLEPDWRRVCQKARLEQPPARQCARRLGNWLATTSQVGCGCRTGAAAPALVR